MKNVTITLPDDLARWLRVRAAEDDRSVSRWVAELLAGMRRREDKYDVAMKRYLAMKPVKIDWPDGRRPTREELYDGRVFVDTNVFVYRHDGSDPLKQSRAEQWITLLARSRTGRLSFQVLQELYATLTRKRFDFARSYAREVVEVLAEWEPVAVDHALLDRAQLLEEHHALSWWDSLIVAAAQARECSVLLTEDLQNGYEFDEVRVVDPFASPDRTPEEVLESLAS